MELYRETGDRRYWGPLESLWRSLTERKMYITGGCGALYDGASPEGSRQQRTITRVHQAYGRNYQLPNVTAHGETCANIGNVLWSWRMFEATGEARYMDVVELALYNSVLSGVDLGGTNFLYTNPLRVVRPEPTELRWSRERVPYVSAFCCPPNVARTVAEVGGYAYGRSEGCLWVNLFGAGSVQTDVPGAGVVGMSQETDYPWEGRVRLRMDAVPGGEFGVRVRVPGWARGAGVRVNGGELEDGVRAGSYVLINRLWEEGDVIEVKLPMEARWMEAHPYVEETLDCVAVKRGPLVYCLESADLPEGVGVMEVGMDVATVLNPEFEADLLGGVVVLEGRGVYRPEGDWQGRLYRDLETVRGESVWVRLVPYYAWGNRGEGEMTVWMRK